MSSKESHALSVTILSPRENRIECLYPKRGDLETVALQSCRWTPKPWDVCCRGNDAGYQAVPPWEAFLGNVCSDTDVCSIPVYSQKRFQQWSQLAIRSEKPLLLCTTWKAGVVDERRRYVTRYLQRTATSDDAPVVRYWGDKGHWLSFLF